MDKLLARFNINVKDLEFNRFGIQVSSILIQDCTAAVAIMLFLLNGLPYIGVIICATAAMVANALGIAQQPMKWVVISSIISIIISIVLLIYGLIMA